MIRVNLLLLAAAVVIAVLPLILPLPGGLAEPFAGADAQAQAAITAAKPDYQPWFRPPLGAAER